MSQRNVKPQTVLKQIDLLVDIADLLIKTADICLALLDAVIADTPSYRGSSPSKSFITVVFPLLLSPQTAYFPPETKEKSRSVKICFSP